MGKLDEEIEKLEERHAEQDVQRHLANHSSQRRNIALMVLGGIRVLGNYASMMSADAFKALIRIGEDKLFEEFQDANGNFFTRFADFLDQSPESPMTKAAYYERKALFDKEGERLFDIYGELGLSIRKRKLLGKGNVEIDGENVVIHDAEGLETIIPIDDHARLMEVVTAVVDSKIDLQNRFDRQQQKIEKHDEKVRELYDENDRIRAAKAADFAADSHMIVRVELGLAFDKITGIVSKLSPVEKEQFRDGVLADVAGWSSSLRSAYRTDGAEKPVPTTLVGDTLDEKLINFMADIDLDAATDNDGDLAAQL